jgi:hypothetical protein
MSACIIAVELVILLFTNPSNGVFQKYLDNNGRKFTYTKRTINFFLFSIHRKDWGEIDDRTYIGVLGSFILIKKKTNIL